MFECGFDHEREGLMRRYLCYLGFCLITISVGCGPAISQQIGTVEDGRALARQVCASCHAIDKGEQLSPQPFAPTFQTIADTPGMTPTALSIFLKTPHATMPNLVLSDDELGNVITYILSLKQ
jgi:mono/diheme cytochrome c family protein